jgi:hypothetical protein
MVMIKDVNRRVLRGGPSQRNPFGIPLYASTRSNPNHIHTSRSNPNHTQQPQDNRKISCLGQVPNHARSGASCHRTGPRTPAHRRKFAQRRPRKACKRSGVDSSHPLFRNSGKRKARRGSEDFACQFTGRTAGWYADYLPFVGTWEFGGLTV